MCCVERKIALHRSQPRDILKDQDGAGQDSVRGSNGCGGILNV